MPPNIHSKEVCTALIAALKSSICGVHMAFRNGTCKLNLRPYCLEGSCLFSARVAAMLFYSCWEKARAFQIAELGRCICKGMPVSLKPYKRLPWLPRHFSVNFWTVQESVVRRKSFFLKRNSAFRSSLSTLSKLNGP